MNTLKFVLAQMRRRWLQALVGVLLLAFGIAALVFVSLVQSQVTRQLTRDAAGIDLVVGARGSPRQLVLCMVSHVDVPAGNIPASVLTEIRSNPQVAQAIPLALADSFEGFRIVGTEPALTQLYGAHIDGGRLWEAPLEAVLGAEVARRTGVAVGSRIVAAHGLTRGAVDHEEPGLVVVGRLAPTGTAVDRLVLTAVESVRRVHQGENGEGAARRGAAAPEPELTALLLRYAAPTATAALPALIETQGRLMTATPAVELAQLGAAAQTGATAARLAAWTLVALALLALFMALQAAFEERRRDVAIVRLLGASPARVAWMWMLEAWLLAALACALGLMLALGAIVLTDRWLAAARAFRLSAVDWTPQVVGILIAALLVATIAATLPAWRASRISVADALTRD